MSAADFMPDRMNLTALRDAAAECEGCELYRHATQTVFGRGPRGARIMLVGEMPGDQEDLQGKPFVGPAGRLLTETMDEAGIAASEVYVTNAVKHFRWEERGERRLHKTPTSRQLSACKPWLDAEIDVVSPSVIVCLGATASKSLLGREFRLTQQRGRVFPGDSGVIVATYHPSAILRSPQKDVREKKRGELVDDLRLAAEHIASRS